MTEAALDWHTFTSAQKTPIPDATSAGRPPRAPAEVDPPLHTAYRDLLNRFFTPEYIRRIEPVIRRTARGLISRSVSLGEVDAVESFTFLMPVQVQCIFLGISVEDAHHIKTTINRIIDAGAAGDSATHKAANDDIYSVLAARKKTPYDANDLISAMIHEEVEGRRLSDDEIAGTICLFLQAGHGTTTNMLGSIIRHLATTPRDQKRLWDEPKLIPQAIEEKLCPGLAHRRLRDSRNGRRVLHQGDAQPTVARVERTAHGRTATRILSGSGRPRQLQPCGRLPAPRAAVALPGDPQPGA
ncbi:cytochrome P450 [Streptomyces ochraceiscleroticus]|uniref:Cytochrome P450 n=1 Tax=Streptomyces ochraceiscleroticus TaxID=47761 RepID=A0ABW1MV58_9ACTN